VLKVSTEAIVDSLCKPVDGNGRLIFNPGGRNGVKGSNGSTEDDVLTDETVDAFSSGVKVSLRGDERRPSFVGDKEPRLAPLRLKIGGGVDCSTNWDLSRGLERGTVSLNRLS